MQQTPIHPGTDRRPESEDGGRQAASGHADVVRRLTEELDRSQDRARSLLYELAGITRDLEEKDILLREADHRLRNVLHMACSMLQREARKTGDQIAHDELLSAGARLKAIAEIQVGLHQVGDRAAIDDLLARVCRAMALNPQVDLDVRAPAVQWPAAVASPLGLFASEAVCNAIKHAFGDERGQVLVQLDRADDYEWRLSVSDNGRGGPDHLKPGFGLRLLGLLARQLRGRLDLSTGLGGRGLCVSVVFPNPGALAGPNPVHA